MLQMTKTGPSSTARIQGLNKHWASLIAQLVKNPPAMQETWAWSLGWEDPLKKGTATHSSILAWRIPGTVYGVTKSQTRLSNFSLFTGSSMVKNPPATQATWARSLGWEDPLENGKATHSSILAWRIPWTVCGVARSQTWLSDFHFHFCPFYLKRRFCEISWLI